MRRPGRSRRTAGAQLHCRPTRSSCPSGPRRSRSGSRGRRAARSVRDPRQPQHRLAAELAGEDRGERRPLLGGAALVDVDDEAPRRAWLVVVVADHERSREAAQVDSPACPSPTSHERTPKQIPCVERPPLTPPTIRQGQIASQLHDSKYAPLMRQGSAPLRPRVDHETTHDGSREASSHLIRLPGGSGRGRSRASATQMPSAISTTATSARTAHRSASTFSAKTIAATTSIHVMLMTPTANSSDHQRPAAADAPGAVLDPHPDGADRPFQWCITKLSGVRQPRRHARLSGVSW